MRNEPKCVQVVRRKRADGTEAHYYYHRPTGTPLPLDPEERRLEAARLNGETLPGSSSVKGSLAWVIDDFRAGEACAKLDDSTRHEYAWYLDKLTEEFGDLPVGAIGREGVKEYRKTLLEAGKAFNTFHRLNKLKMVLNYARLELKLMREDPFEGIKIPSPPMRSSVWAPDDDRLLLERAPPLVRRAFLVAAYTAQRPADCYNMTYDGIGQAIEQDGRKVLWIMLRQRKTRVPVWVPLHPTLQAEIATRLNGKSNLIAPSPTGKVWVKNNFARAFRAVRIEAGLPDSLQFRDLRRTAMVRRAEAGATIPQIAAISGHSIERTQKVLEHYLPRNRRMALGAMDLLVERGRHLRRGFMVLQGGATAPDTAPGAPKTEGATAL